MQVLKSGIANNKWPKKIVCPRCKAELLVDKRDCTYTGESCICSECNHLIQIEIVPRTSSYNPFESREHDIFPF